MPKNIRHILVVTATIGMITPCLQGQDSRLPPSAGQEIDFMRDVDPIFQQHCYMCHGDEASMNGFSLWRGKSAIRGGYSGKPAIVPRDSANSRLIHLVAGLEENLMMPPTGGQLTDEQVGILRAWIDQGPKFASDRFDASTRRDEQPWLHMDYGPVISASTTVREPEDPRADKGPDDNVSYKSHAIMLADERRAGIIFDTELLRVAAAWNGPQYVLTGTVYDWRHGPHPYLSGKPVFETPVAPGWARDGSFTDPRSEGFGPLPKDWAKYKGRFMFGDKVVLSYSVGETDVLEMAGLESDWGVEAVTRTFEIGPTREALVLEVAAAEGSTPRQLSLKKLTPGQGPAIEHLVHLGGDEGAAIGVSGLTKKARWDLSAPGEVRLQIPASSNTRHFAIHHASLPARQLGAFAGALREAPRPERLEPYTRGGPRVYRGTVVTQGRLGEGGPWAVDEITLPFENPWESWFRPTDFAFFDDDRAAVATWSGDVWIVDGVDEDLDNLVWSRFAVGFHMPQGLEVVDGTVYVLDRDQITRLHDLNGDGQADYYENFNNDFHVTHHFHEFTFDLDRDPEGNFYFAKAARHALPAKVKHHGVIFKLDPEGENLEVVCRGFRVPNGVAVGPNGEITTSDQEGHWIPSTRVNLCSPGSFHGYMWSGGVDPDRKDYDDPITWLPISVDNSGAGQAWVGTDRWGPFQGHLVHSSFGRGKIFLMLMERAGGTVQGGAVELPVDFDTGLMRPDFRKSDGNLYLAGLYGWGTKRKAVGGLFRVRYSGGEVLVPSALHVSRQGIDVSFLHELDPASAEDPANYLVRRWNYKWLSRYGSDRWKLDGEPGIETMAVRSVRLLPDRKTIRIEVDDLRRVMQMMTSMRIQTAGGDLIETEISHSIHAIPEQPGEPFTTRVE